MTPGNEARGAAEEDERHRRRSLLKNLVFGIAVVMLPGAFGALTAATFLGALVEAVYHQIRPPAPFDPDSFDPDSLF